MLVAETSAILCTLYFHISHAVLAVSAVLSKPQKPTSEPFLPENQCFILNYAAWRK